MNRGDLEALDRDTLVARAGAAGVPGARVLTRPELIDELILRSAADPSSKQRSRGLFGRARDLLARIVERGLNRPDAADRIRAMGAPPPSPPARAALPTVTLAQIYAAQGHRMRAIETLDRVLVHEPGHATAGVLLTHLQDETYSVPSPILPPESDEDPRDERTVDESARATSEAAPTGSTSESNEVDECVAIPVDARTLYVYWQARGRTLDAIRQCWPDGALTLRALVVVPTWDGPRSSVRDHAVTTSDGGHFVHDLPVGCVVRAAIGFRHGESFIALAHSPALATPPGSPSCLDAGLLIRWTPQGEVPVSPVDGDHASIEKALDRARREAASIL